MELGTEINAVAKYFAELVRKREIVQADTSESAGLELCENIHITSVGFEAIAQGRAEERERTNPPLGTKACDPLPVDLDGQVSRCH